jgi:hypothetical protein
VVNFLVDWLLEDKIYTKRGLSDSNKKRLTRFVKSIKD